MIKVNGIEIPLQRFPNQELKIGEFGLAEPLHVTLKDWDGVSGFMQMLLFCHAHKNRRESLYLPYLPYSRMDRMVSGQAFTLPVIADLINGLSFEQVIIGEPHSDVSPALIRNSRIAHVTAALLSMYIGAEPDVKHALILPDAGAAKRYQDLVGWPMIEGRKKRDPETGKLSGFHAHFNQPRENYQGCRFVIVDDLCSYGGTFIGIADEIERVLGLTPEIVLIVAHTEYAIFDGKIPQDKRFVEVITTDSMLDPSTLVGKWTCSKLTVLDSEQFMED